MGKQYIGVKRTYTIPKKLAQDIRVEAEKRLKLWKIGKMQIGSIERDIICIALHLSMNEIEKMSDFQFKKLSEEIK